MLPNISSSVSVSIFLPCCLHLFRDLLRFSFSRSWNLSFIKWYLMKCVWKLIDISFTLIGIFLPKKKKCCKNEKWNSFLIFLRSEIVFENFYIKIKYLCNERLCTSVNTVADCKICFVNGLANLIRKNTLVILHLTLPLNHKCQSVLAQV